MPANKEDWRFNGQDEYLFGVQLTFQTYAPTEGNDHDHCEFCGAKFSHVIPGSLDAGYATTDRYRWICPDCFEDFRELFQWARRPNDCN